MLPNLKPTLPLSKLAATLSYGGTSTISNFKLADAECWQNFKVDSRFKLQNMPQFRAMADLAATLSYIGSSPVSNCILADAECCKVSSLLFQGSNSNIQQFLSYGGAVLQACCNRRDAALRGCAIKHKGEFRKLKNE